MADRVSYPQIPSAVWWGVREYLKRNPNILIDERLLVSEFKIQLPAARQYIAELKRTSIISEENRATEIAKRWRLDDTYAEAVKEIATQIYPEQLLDFAPPGEADRQRVAAWFQQEGLGSGTALNKASTYLLITSAEPGSTSQSGAAKKSPSDKKTQQSKPKQKNDKKAAPIAQSPEESGGEARVRRTEMMPVNINLQIHISADATKDQIETIFASMARYLYNDNAN